MKGNRKLTVIVLYILAVTGVALAVVFHRQDTLLGVAGFAGGLSTGIWGFMYSNAQEHKADKAQ